MAAKAEIIKAMFKTNFVLWFQVDFKTSVFTFRSPLRYPKGPTGSLPLCPIMALGSLLYGTLSLIVKCTSGALHLKMFVFSIYLWNFGKFSIFLFSSDSFNVKNDIIHTFFSLFWLQILNLPASLQNKNTRIGPFPWKRLVLQNPDQERTNQSTGICLRLGLPYNNTNYWMRFTLRAESAVNDLLRKGDRRNRVLSHLSMRGGC